MQDATNKNIIDGCNFSNASDIPKIFNFMMALGEAKDSVYVDAVKNLTGRNVLSISFSWSKEISRQRKYEDIMGSHSINGGLDNIYQIFSSECAKIEVEATSFLASL